MSRSLLTLSLLFGALTLVGAKATGLHPTKEISLELVRRNADEHDDDTEAHNHTERLCFREHILQEEFEEIAEEYATLAGSGSTSELPQYYSICREVIVHMGLLSECCLENGTECEGEEEEEGGTSSRIDKDKAYGYGFLMVLLVSVGSVLGVIVVPLIKKNSGFNNTYKYIYALMVALGASALFCDAILHLLPHALELHAHDEETSSHEHEEEGGHSDEGIPDFIWKGSALIAGLYGFFLLEVILHAWNDLHHHGHGHSHGHSHESSDTSNDSIRKNSNSNTELKELHVTMPHGSCDNKGEDTAAIVHPGDGASCDQCTSKNKPTSGELEEGVDTKVKETRGCMKRCVQYFLDMKPLAWLIILGDGIHNFADGLALGAAIAQSLSLGISTTIAIVFHEIPHEFGDYFILLSTGMTWYMALLFNFLSGLTAILGFFVGVAVGTASEEANNWILAIAGGVFIYIALVDLLPELIHSKEQGCIRWGLFVMVNIGFYISFAALLMLAIYEEDLDDLVK